MSYPSCSSHSSRSLSSISSCGRCCGCSACRSTASERGGQSRRGIDRVSTFSSLCRAVAPLVLLVPLVSSAPDLHAQTAPDWPGHYREAAGRLIAAATADHSAWERLALMTDLFGHRLSGSPQLNAAIRWASEEMKRDGLENVHTERVMVP